MGPSDPLPSARAMELADGLMLFHEFKCAKMNAKRVPCSETRCDTHRAALAFSAVERETIERCEASVKKTLVAYRLGMDGEYSQGKEDAAASILEDIRALARTTEEVRGE